MKKTVLYQYLGTNGTIISPIHLEDTYYVRKIRLIAEPGHFLTNGVIFKRSVMIPESELDSWKEIPEGQM